MKILIDARLYGLEHAGLGRYVLNLVDELAKIDQINHYTILLRKSYFEKLKLPPNWEKIAVDVGHYSILEQALLPGIIKKQKPDVVHFPHFNIPVLYRGSFVVTVHDILMHGSKGKDSTTLPFFKYYFKRMGYRFVFSRAVYKSRKIIVPSRYVKKRLSDYYKTNRQKIKVCYEGVTDFTKGEKKEISKETLLEKYVLEKPYFIYVGNAYPHKNLKRAFEAVVLINKKNDKNVQFAVISSRGVFAKRLEKEVKKLKAKKYVKLLGFVPDGHLRVLLKNAEGFVYPSLSEGFGLPGLESMSCGTPVLASDIPVFREIYEDNALYFNPFDFSSIAKTMQETLKMKKKQRRERIKKGKTFIKKYSWRKMAEETLEVYGKINSKAI